MYWQPTQIEGLKCSKGINCNFGICDECQRTHKSYEKEDYGLEDEEADDSTFFNHTNSNDIHIK